MKNVIEINLGRFLSPNSKILSGRNEGFDARKQLKINDFDTNDLEYVIKIPQDTWSINSSFFLGLFGKSIRDIGESKFRKKYLFANWNESLLDDIEDGIVEAQKNKTALEEK